MGIRIPLMLGMCSLLTYAQRGPVPSTNIRPGPTALTALKAALNLSDEQAGQLRDLQQERMQASRQNWDQVAQKQRELNDLLNAANADASAIGAMMIQIRALQKQAPPDEQIYRDKALAVLNPAQKMKLQILEQALQLRPAVDEALSVNLLKFEPIRAAGPSPGLLPALPPAVKK